MTEEQLGKAMKTSVKIIIASMVSLVIGLRVGDSCGRNKVRMRDAWEVQWIYGHNRFATYDKQSKPRKLHKLWAKSPIEACVKAIEWLTASGHKLNENK